MENYVYNMVSPNKGICLIINNETFAPNSGLKRRDGAIKDADRVVECFAAMKFEIRRHDNVSVLAMVNLCEQVAKESHKHNACLIFVLMTHGVSGDAVYGADGAVVDLVDLFEPFKGYNCSGLIGKPKVFIVEGGRGEGLDRGVEQSDATAVESSNKIPHEADIIYGFSTVPDYVSWRNPVNGSWYIQTLCGVLAEHAHSKTLLWMLDRVNHILAFEFQSNNKKHMGMKQMPQIVCQLTKELYLNKT